MARLGDILKIEASREKHDAESYWLLNLDMVEQQTGRIISYNYVGEDNLDGSIIQFDTACVLYSKLRPNLNKVVVPEQNGFATSEMLPLRPNKDVLSRDYLAVFLRSDSFVTWAVSKTAGAKMPRLGTKELLSKEIPLPSLKEQERISNQFGKVDELIALRKAQLAKLDELVKARFVEMFGDPASNPMGWPKMSMRQAIDKGIIEKPLDGNHGEKHPKTSDYVSVGIPFIMANNLVDGSVDLENCAFITKEQADSLDKGFAHDGDVLLTHKGTIGRTAVLHTTYPYIMLTPQVTYYRPIHGLIPEFLKGYFDTEYFQGIIGNIASIGSTRAYIGITAQQELPLIVPTIEKQKSYATFVEQTNKTKLTIQASLDKLEVMKKALMQEYFG